MPTIAPVNATFSRFVGASVLCAMLGSTAGCENPGSETAEPSNQATRTALASETSLKTAVVGVHVGRNGEVAIAFVSKKDTPFSAQPQEGDLRIEARDNRTSALLGVGSAKLPELCSCPATETHYDGDVRRAHEATVLVKVPYTTGAETLSLTAQDRETGMPVTLKADLAKVAQ